MKWLINTILSAMSALLLIAVPSLCATTYVLDFRDNYVKLLLAVAVLIEFGYLFKHIYKQDI